MFRKPEFMPSANQKPTEGQHKKDTNEPTRQPHDIFLKSVVLGDRGVGKSSLIHRFAENKYDSNHISNTVSYLIKLLTCEDKMIKMQVVDTTGEDSSFTNLQKQSAYLSYFYCAVICFDVTDKSSFQTIDKYIQLFLNQTSSPLFVIVGNKADLLDERVVDAEEIVALNKRLHETYPTSYCGYYDVSAQNGTNVANAFERLANIYKSQVTFDPFAGVTEKELEKRFHEQFLKHKQYLWSKTKIKDDSDLKTILYNACRKNTRSRKTCVEIGWLNQDGSIALSAPLLVEKYYYEAKTKLQDEQQIKPKNNL